MARCDLVGLSLSSQPRVKPGERSYTCRQPRAGRRQCPAAPQFSRGERDYHRRRHDILALNTMTTSIFSHCAGNIFKSECFVFPVTVARRDRGETQQRDDSVDPGHQRRRGNQHGLPPRPRLLALAPGQNRIRGVEEGRGPEARFTGLVKAADLDYVCAIEFRPDDLASPRATRRTDDLLPKSRSM